jgi:pyruvate carboxylase
MGLGERWPEIARAYAEVNLAFGDIVKVTPSSKVVGDLAIFLVNHGISVKEFERLDEHHTLNIPNSVVDMFMGSLGEPEGGWPERIRRVVLRGAQPRPGRPGEHLAPVDFQAVQTELEAKVGHPIGATDLMSYLMYPEVYLKFDGSREACGDLSRLPTPLFFYGMQIGEEVSVELDPGKILVIKLLTVGEAQTDGHRTLFFELNGKPRETRIKDRSLRIETPVRAKADSAIPGQVGAPIPGLVAVIAVDKLQRVEKGDRLLVMEAMKMQTTLYAPISGQISKLLVQPGDQVESKDLLLVIE